MESNSICCNWPLSLSIVFSKFIHVLASVSTSFLFYGQTMLHWMETPPLCLSIHRLVNIQWIFKQLSDPETLGHLFPSFLFALPIIPCLSSGNCPCVLCCSTVSRLAFYKSLSLYLVRALWMPKHLNGIQSSSILCYCFSFYLSQTHLGVWPGIPNFLRSQHLVIVCSRSFSHPCKSSIC